MVYCQLHGINTFTRMSAPHFGDCIRTHAIYLVIAQYAVVKVAFQLLETSDWTSQVRSWTSMSCIFSCRPEPGCFPVATC